MNFNVKKTGAKPKIIDGVTFECWHTGIMRYEWRSPDARLAVESFRTGYAARVDGEWIHGAGGKKAKQFRSIENAMVAAVSAGRQDA